jgi:4-alpha-glucanotransferase
MNPRHRTSGILLHPTSLPGPFGIGDLGPSAYRFIDFLEEAGQGLWQVLPLGPTGYGSSPYQCLSAFAGNPILISPELLAEDGWLETAELDPPRLPKEQVEYGRVEPRKWSLLRKAFARFESDASSTQRNALTTFGTRHADWLEHYALFAALKAHHRDRAWTEWAPDLALRKPDALSRWSEMHADDLEFFRFVQFLFFRQWDGLHDYASNRGIRLIGDVPIFVAHDSSEVWSHPEWFYLDKHGNPTVVAGVPPDYFSATGQRWGNPLYRWDRLGEDGFRFWVDRLRLVLGLVDIVRIDHFRGFAGYWQIPADEETAIKGKWIPGPGMRFFEVLRRNLGDRLPLIAEDLGVITEDVIELRDRLDLPGMAILQFAFEPPEGGFGRPEYLPHNHGYNLAVYTGTHDNNTLLGWWSDKPDSIRTRAADYLNADASAINLDFIRCALASVARYAVFPLQDLLGLGAHATMNRPGKADGNWTWRFRAESLDRELATELRKLTELYGRTPFSAIKG